MKYDVILRPEAENDLSAAFLWYENKRRGLGYDFLLHVEAGLKFIERGPAIYATRLQRNKNTFHQKVSL